MRHVVEHLELRVRLFRFGVKDPSVSQAISKAARLHATGRLLLVTRGDVRLEVPHRRTDGRTDEWAIFRLRS